MSTRPYQPPIFRYTVFFRTAGAVSIVTDRPLHLEPGDKWIRAKEYHPDVSKFGWAVYLKDVHIKIKEIAYILFEGEIDVTIKTKETTE